MQGVAVSGHKYLCCYALPLPRTNAHILRLPFELQSLADTDTVLNITIINSTCEYNNGMHQRSVTVQSVSISCLPAVIRLSS